MASIDAGQTKLARSLKGLLDTWDSVQEHWTDSVRRDFEDRHLQELCQRVRSTLSAMDRLSEALRRARAECGDPH
jgi:chemotaxis regulatin CheY-phosphate phosphatase CheZ